MVLDPSRVPDVREARRALHALYLDVPSAVAQSVAQRVEAAFAALAREARDPRAPTAAQTQMADRLQFWVTRAKRYRPHGTHSDISIAFVEQVRQVLQGAPPVSPSVAEPPQGPTCQNPVAGLDVLIDLRGQSGDVRYTCPICDWRVTLTPEGEREWLGTQTDPVITPMCRKDRVALVRTMVP